MIQSKTDQLEAIVGRTPNHLVATLLNSFHQSKIAMPTDRYRNFRLRGIPFECQSRAEVRELVKGIFSINSGASFVVHSLATNPIDNHSKVSTLTFNDIPACLSDECKTEWVFNVPTSELYNRESFSQGISLVFDTHFSGFTPLQHTRDDDCSVE
jgi:hypothetical protein